MLTQPFKVLGRKDVSWILQNFSSVAENSSLTFLFLHELSFNSLSVWFFWPKSGNFTKICCWYKSTFVITGHHHYLPTELWAQFFLHYDICKTQKKTVFSRSLEPEKKHLQYCTKSSTSSSVSSRRVHFLSQPNDPSGFFWLFFATSALSQEFPEGKWDVTFTDKLIMSKELQQQREATVKAL